MLCAAALACVGCLGRVHTPLAGPADWAAARPAAPVPAALRPSPPGPPAVDLEYRKRVLGYEIYDLRFSSAGGGPEDDRLEARYYRREGPGPRGVVVILPIWGRSAYPPLVTTGRLIRRGELNVIVLEGEKSLFDWERLAESPTEEAFLAEVRAWAGRYTTMIEDVRRLVDWAVSRPETDADRIGLVGFSISAVMAATIVGLEPRVTHGVFVMGGGRIEAIFASCPRQPGRVRERVLERFGWDREELVARLAPELEPINPVTYAGRIDPRRVLIIDAGRDRCVPASAREELWEAMGEPERITILSGHNFSFLSLTFIDNFRATKDIARFFHRRMREGPAPMVAGPAGR